MILSWHLKDWRSILTGFCLVGWIAIAPAWGDDPLLGAPAKYQADLQKIRESRARRLPKRNSDLADAALKAYFAEGMPTDAAGLGRAMEATDATAFLPDVKAMLAVKDTYFSAVEDRAAIKALVDHAEQTGRLSYRELVDAFRLYAYKQTIDNLPGKTVSSYGFPLILETPEARGFTKDAITNFFIEGIGPIEITQNAKRADGIKRSPRAYANHDASHIVVVFDGLKSVHESERFSVSVRLHILRLEMEKTIEKLKMTEAKFGVFHERIFPFIELLKRLAAISDPNIRQFAIENAVGIGLDNTGLLPSRQKALFRNLRNRARIHLSSPNLGVRRESAWFFAKTSFTYDNGRWLDNESRDALFNAIRDPDAEVRFNALRGLLEGRSRWDIKTQRAALRVLTGTDEAMKEYIFERSRFLGVDESALKGAALSNTIKSFDKSCLRRFLDFMGR